MWIKSNYLYTEKVDMSNYVTTNELNQETTLLESKISDNYVTKSLANEEYLTKTEAESTYLNNARGDNRYRKKGSGTKYKLNNNTLQISVDESNN